MPPSRLLCSVPHSGSTVLARSSALIWKPCLGWKLRFKDHPSPQAAQRASCRYMAHLHPRSQLSSLFSLSSSQTWPHTRGWPASSLTHIVYLVSWLLFVSSLSSGCCCSHSLQLATTSNPGGCYWGGMPGSLGEKCLLLFLIFSTECFSVRWKAQQRLWCLVLSWILLRPSKQLAAVLWD